MAQRRGADFQITINGVAYSVGTIGVNAHTADIITSNTEGIPGNPLRTDRVPFSTSRIPDLNDGELQFGATTFDDADNPFAGPISLVLGGYYNIGVFPMGVAAGVSYGWFNCMCTAFSHSGRVPGPQPFSVTFKPDGVSVLEMLGV